MAAGSLNANDLHVLDVLRHATKPLSAYDILRQSTSAALKAPVQVYRSREKKERIGAGHRIEALIPFVACAGGDPRRGPGFVICRDCGAVREFEDERVLDVARAAAGEGFSIDRVSLEVFGHCAACGSHGNRH